MYFCSKSEDTKLVIPHLTTDIAGGIYTLKSETYPLYQLRDLSIMFGGNDSIEYNIRAHALNICRRLLVCILRFYH